MLKLGDEEFVQIEMRKHWFILLAELAAYIVLYFVPFIIWMLISGYEVPISATETLNVSLSPAYGMFIAAAWTLVIWMRLVGIWTDYYLDIWIVTNKRIIDLEQKGLFHRKSSVFRIERIQDITVETRGIIATLLNFGNLHVQTAGEAHEFSMNGIANPRSVREIILKQHDLVTEAARDPIAKRSDAVG